jgi:hypothetical protein
MIEHNSSRRQVYGEQQAKGYEDDPEHTLFSFERQAWLDTLDALSLFSDARVLDFGGGNWCATGSAQGPWL